MSVRRPLVRSPLVAVALLAGIGLSGCYHVENPILEQGEQVSGLTGPHRHINNLDDKNPDGKPVEIQETQVEGEGTVYRIIKADGSDLMTCRFEAIDHQTHDEAYVAECAEDDKPGYTVYLAIRDQGGLGYYATFHTDDPEERKREAAFFDGYGVEVGEAKVDDVNVPALYGDPADIRAGVRAYFSGWTDLTKENGSSAALIIFRQS